MELTKAKLTDISALPKVKFVDKDDSIENVEQYKVTFESTPECPSMPTLELTKSSEHVANSVQNIYKATISLVEIVDCRNLFDWAKSIYMDRIDEDRINTLKRIGFPVELKR